MPDGRLSKPPSQTPVEIPTTLTNKVEVVLLITRSMLYAVHGTSCVVMRPDSNRHNRCFNLCILSRPVIYYVLSSINTSTLQPGLNTFIGNHIFHLLVVGTFNINVFR